MKILITGGAGFIGSYLAERLVLKGHKVTILDNFESGKLKNLSKIKRRIKLIDGDIKNEKIVDKSMHGIDIVFHLAAKITVYNSFNNTSSFEDTNIYGTLNLLKSSQRNCIKKFIFASSAAVYGNTKHIPICETAKTVPISVLGKTKLKAEEYCIAYRKKGLDTVILRLFNVYGPRQNPVFLNVITNFIQQFSSGKTPIIYGDGNQTRDFIHIDDLINVCLLSMKNETKNGFIFNIGTEKEYSVNQLFEIISKITKRWLKPKYLPNRKGEIKNSTACICRARRVLNFEPRLSLTEGLLKIID